MATPKTPFEATSSWCYSFARYEALPEILTMPEIAGGGEVMLRDFTQKVLDTYLSADQQNETYKKAKSEGEVKIKSAVKFFVAYMASETGAMENLGKGKFRLQTAANTAQAVVDAVEAAAVDDVEPENVDEDDFDGWLYAFTFPPLQRADDRYPIKIGKTINDPHSRMIDQCKSSAAFDVPVLLGSWQVKRMSHMESAVHYILKARGQWRELAPGREWFDTTPDEVAAIIKMIVA